MTVAVFTAVTDAAGESALVAALDGADCGISVVRRCVDVADLLAAAAAGTAQAALVSPDLRRLDSDVLRRLGAGRVAVVGVLAPGDEAGERRLRQLGVEHLVGVDAEPATVADAIRAALVGGSGTTRPVLLPDQTSGVRLSDPDGGGEADGRGEVVAVWGPTGAPGRTTVALGLADEFARAGEETLIVDADVYGGVLGQLVGVLDEAPGVAAAARLQSSGGLDVSALAGLCRSIGPRLRVLTGIARADRWPEVRADAVLDLLERARRLAAVTVVDCGFCLEQDEELAYDTLAPRRNGATLAALESADTVLAVGTADPVGIARLVRALADLADAVPGVHPQVVVNRTRRGVTPGDPQREISAALRRHAGVGSVHFLPEDRDACDRAMGAGRTLAEVIGSSPLRKALTRTARELRGVPAVPEVMTGRHGVGRRTA